MRTATQVSDLLCQMQARAWFHGYQPSHRVTMWGDMGIKGMATPETRLARLQEWIDDQFAGNVAGFCRYYNLGRSMASFIYQLTAGSRTFGERAARSLEEATGRPLGWLDQPLVQDTSDPIQYDRALCRQLPVPERKLIEDFIVLVLTRNRLRDYFPISRSVSLHSPEQEGRTNLEPGRSAIGKTNKRKRVLNLDEPASPPPAKRRSTR